MPDITGTLNPPRLGSPPSSPALGQIYYDNSTTPGVLYWWDGTTWKSASGGSAAPEVYVGPNTPTRNQEVIWVDTDESPPAVTRDINMEPPHIVGQPGEPAFQNSWVNFDTSVYPAGRSARFRKYPDGRVRLAGLIRGGANGSVMFTLPVGYRPYAAGTNSPLTIAVTNASGGLANISVDTNGGVSAYPISPATLSNIYLDGFEFDTESVVQATSTVAQPMEPWHTVGAAGEPPALNSWTLAPLQFRKAPDGKVQIRGNVSNGTNATAMFVLPAGYRPGIQVLFPVVGTNGAAGNYLQIGTDGSVLGIRAGAALNVTIEFDTDTVNNFVAGSLPGPQRALSLPATPFDGQECYLVVDATNNVLWHMRYNQGRVKWESVGAPPIFYLHEGSNAAYVALVNGEYITTSAAKTTRLGWTFTPLVDCWVETTFVLGLVQKTDAAYHYGNPSIVVTPGAVQGANSPMIYHTQHVSVQTYEYYTISKTFALAGGTPYTMQCVWACNGGTWQYQQGPTTLWMTGKAWPR